MGSGHTARTGPLYHELHSAFSEDEWNDKLLTPAKAWRRFALGGFVLGTHCEYLQQHRAAHTLQLLAAGTLMGGLIALASATAGAVLASVFGALLTLVSLLSARYIGPACAAHRAAWMRLSGYSPLAAADAHLAEGSDGARDLVSRLHALNHHSASAAPFAQRARDAHHLYRRAGLPWLFAPDPLATHEPADPHGLRDGVVVAPAALRGRRD